MLMKGYYLEFAKIVLCVCVRARARVCVKNFFIIKMC